MTTETDDEARHKAKMANRKAVQDAEVAGKTIEKGLLIVHTGKGKGKSTAAFVFCCAPSDEVFSAAWCSSAREPGRPASALRSSVLAIRSNGTHLVKVLPGKPRIVPAMSPPQSAPGTGRLN